MAKQFAMDFDLATPLFCFGLTWSAEIYGAIDKIDLMPPKRGNSFLPASGVKPNKDRGAASDNAPWEAPGQPKQPRNLASCQPIVPRTAPR